jgi:signal transduction histidine kinase
MSMKRGSAVALVVLLLIAALSVLGFVFTKRGVDSQNQALLNNDTTQAGVYVSSIFSGVSSSLDGLASEISADGGSPSAFAGQARSLVSGPIAIALMRRQGATWVVAAAVGPGLPAGQVAGPRLSAALGIAGAKLTPVLVKSTGKISTLGFAKGAPLVPAGLAVYEQLTIPTFIALPSKGNAAFHEINAVVYAAPRARPSALVLADTPSLPLSGPLSHAAFALGSATWLIVASAKSPLAGGFPNEAPYVLLGVGLLLALAMALLVDILRRRQLYAAAMVAERTAELTATHDALVRGERLAAVGEMATIVGHELRNPLAAVTNAHYLIRQSLGDTTKTEKHLAMAERELARAAHLAEDLTAYMRDRAPVPVTLHVHELVREVLEASPPPPGIVVSDDTDSVTLTADRAQVGQILTNLVTNAYQAMHDSGSLRLTAATDNGTAVITVEDDGEGIDPETAAKAFEPFFTTRADGTGLGLAIVRRLAEGHGGSVSMGAGVAGGTVFTVRLPLEPPVEVMS